MLVLKMFLSERIEGAGGLDRYKLGVVCRGEENKDWAAATPSGALEIPCGDAVLDDLWKAYRAGGHTGSPEVYVYVRRDASPDETSWKFKKCEFGYKDSVAVEFGLEGFSGNGYRWGKLTMNVNNGSATEALRKAFAESLVAGEPMMFSLSFRQHDAESGG